MIMQGCVISCGTVVFFQKSRDLSRSLLTNNNFYCAILKTLHKIIKLISKTSTKRTYPIFHTAELSQHENDIGKDNRESYYDHCRIPHNRFRGNIIKTSSHIEKDMKAVVISLFRPIEAAEAVPVATG